MNILSIYGGIGSMIIAAKNMGYNIIAGFDPRKSFHTGTFEYNFGKKLYRDFNDLVENENINNVDVIVGHPSCGAYSRMSNINSNPDNKFKKSLEILDFIKIVKFIKPKFFIMDNLPKSLIMVPFEKWKYNFPEYDIYFEWISNYNYGNTQKGRKRLFIIGSKKDLDFVFIPGEFNHDITVRTVIGDLPSYSNIKEINHVHLPDDTIINMKNKHIKKGIKTEDIRNLTLAEWKEWIKLIPYGKRFYYISNSGIIKYKPGNWKINIDSYSGVILGDQSSYATSLYRGDTLNPLTIRERARIQGCPDNFIFLPLDIEEWKNHKLLRFQTGKYISYEFTSYLMQQIKNFMDNGKLYEDYSKRIIKHNDIVTRAKFLYCKNNKYSNQEKACKHCWLECKK